MGLLRCQAFEIKACMILGGRNHGWLLQLQLTIACMKSQGASHSVEMQFPLWNVRSCIIYRM